MSTGAKAVVLTLSLVIQILIPGAPPAAAAGNGGPMTAVSEGAILTVAQDGSGDFTTIQDAVNQARSGDRIVVGSGLYHESVRIETSGVVLEGMDRESVVIDGNFEDGFNDGIHVHRAAHVSLRNLTVQRFLANGVYFMESDYFRAVNVTALDNRLYGLYATHSRHGEFAYSEAAGSGDSGFYFGEVSNCNCTIREVAAHDNVIGYSGTRSTHVIIRDSRFYNNSVGILPNTLVPDIAHMVGEHASLEAFWPSHYTIENNIIENNNNRNVKAYGWTARYGVPIGTGVALAGAMFNTVAGNAIRGHERWGVAEFFFVVPPFGNTFTSNIFQENQVDFWRDGYGLGSCQKANSESYEGSSSVLPSCDLNPALRLSVPDPTKHVTLMIESERPQGTFSDALPVRPAGRRDSLSAATESATLGLLLLAILAVFGASSREGVSGSSRPRIGFRRPWPAWRRPAPRSGTERDATSRRMGAALIDASIVALVYGLLIAGLIASLLPLAGLFDIFEAVLTVSLVFSPLAFIISFAIWFVYAGLLEGIYGQTVGKRLLKIVVIRTNGSDITMRSSLLRNALRYVDGIGLYLLGLVFMLVTKRKQRIGDKLARTVVVHSE
ncbi:MAG: pectinesterase family protein [Thermoplasmata archaeon]